MRKTLKKILQEWSMYGVRDVSSNYWIGYHYIEEYLSSNGEKDIFLRVEIKAGDTANSILLAIGSREGSVWNLGVRPIVEVDASNVTINQ